MIGRFWIQSLNNHIISSSRVERWGSSIIDVFNSFNQFSSGQSGLPLWLCFHSLCHLSLCLDHRLWKDWAISNKELEHQWWSSWGNGRPICVHAAWDHSKWYECRICVHIVHTLILFFSGDVAEAEEDEGEQPCENSGDESNGPAEIENIVEQLLQRSAKQRLDYPRNLMEMLSPVRWNEATLFSCECDEFCVLKSEITGLEVSRLRKEAHSHSVTAFSNPKSRVHQTIADNKFI